MSVTDYYSPSCQFRRALGVDWRLYGVNVLCGVLYPLMGYYLFRHLGMSQVYNVTWPFVVTAAYMAYLTRRLCLPEVKRASAAYYFNRPQTRLIALDAHAAFLCMASLWLIGWAFVGSVFKLGGAGFTACYRFHPEFVVLPFFLTALTMRHIYLIRSLGFWGRSAAWYVLLIGWLVWRLNHIDSLSAGPANNYWPDRSMSLLVEWMIAASMAGCAFWVVFNTRNRWPRRQIGGIR